APLLSRGDDPAGGRRHRESARIPPAGPGDQPVLPCASGRDRGADPQRARRGTAVTGLGPAGWRAARVTSPLVGAGLVVVLALALMPTAGLAHPLGNFSISQYTAIRVDADAVELRYLIDLAEIPTFQELQEAGIVAEAGHPSLSGYVARKVEQLKQGLRL